METRALIAVMPKVVQIIKKRFPNLSAEEAVKITSEILEVIRVARDEK